MKVLMLNGSPRKGGNTELALREMEKVFLENGIETEIISIGTDSVSGCRACGGCMKLGKCVIDDQVNEIAEKFKNADGLVIGSPVYFASANGSLISLLDRLFFSKRFNCTMKVGAAIAVARRGGCSATFDELNKYFTISGMPVASSVYWNSVHGRAEGEACQDLEGMQTVRILAANISFLMKSIDLGKETYGLPELKEDRVMTNFIH